MLKSADAQRYIQFVQDVEIDDNLNTIASLVSAAWWESLERIDSDKLTMSKVLDILNDAEAAIRLAFRGAE